MEYIADVVAGSGRGKVLGFPTINVDTSTLLTKLEDGVYAGQSFIEDAWMPSVIHVGLRPTFNASASIEIHILDTELEEPPTQLQFKTVKKIRGTKKFSTGEELAEQIGKDIQQARAILSSDDSKA